MQKNYPIVPVNDNSHNVLQGWLGGLSLKQQTVLIVALRGFDGVGKTDKSKPLVKALRATILRNADAAEPFMKVTLTWDDVVCFFKDSHHYPLHWFMHFVHAAQILGYKHPNLKVREWWYESYLLACEMLHVNRETEEQMDNRLADRC